jgi:hypothetical protein
MTKLIRYVYVGAPNSTVVHLCRSANYHIEGAETDCGLRTRPRWFYWLGRRSLPKNRTICKKCRN